MTRTGCCCRVKRPSYETNSTCPPCWSRHGLKKARGGRWEDDVFALDFYTLMEDLGLSENVGYIPNELAIFHRDNDQQNHWV